MAKTKTSIMTKAKLQIRFDAIADDFDPDDEISVESANYEMHKDWRRFLRAGISATAVAKMMSPADVWKHYHKLRNCGAVIDMDLLADGRYTADDTLDATILKGALDRDVSTGKALELLKRCHVCDGWEKVCLFILVDYGLPKAHAREYLEEKYGSRVPSSYSSIMDFLS